MINIILVITMMHETLMATLKLSSSRHPLHGFHNNIRKEAMYKEMATIYGLNVALNSKLVF